MFFRPGWVATLGFKHGRTYLQSRSTSPRTGRKGNYEQARYIDPATSLQALTALNFFFECIFYLQREGDDEARMLRDLQCASRTAATDLPCLGHSPGVIIDVRTS